MRRAFAAAILAAAAFVLPAAAPAQSAPPYQPVIIVPADAVNRALASPKPPRRPAKQAARRPAPRPSAFADPTTFGTVKSGAHDPRSH